MLARVARNTAAQGLYLVVQFADRFLVVGILLRAWGTEVYSNWAVLLSCVGLLSLGELGLNIYYGNVVQRAWAVGDGQRFQRTIATALTCSLAVALALGILGLAVLTAVDVPRLLSVHAIPHTDALAVAMLLGVATLLRIARGSISQIFRGRQEYALGVAVEGVNAVSLLALTIAVGLFGLDPVALAGAYLASELVAGWGFMLWVIHKRYPDLVIAPKVPSRSETNDIARHAKWFAMQQGAPVAWLQLPVVLLGYLGAPGPSLVSFVVLRTLVNFMRSIASMISTASGVEIATEHHAGHRGAAWRHLQTVGFGLAVLTAAIAAGIVIFGPSLVEIWTGRTDLYDRVIVISLLASCVLAAPSAPIGAHLILTNAPRAVSIPLVLQIAVGLTGCAILARQFGAAGAAIALAVGEAVGQAVVLPLFASRHLEGFGYPAYLMRCAIVVALSATWSTVIGMAATSVLDMSQWPGLITAGALWTAFGLVPPLLFALPRRQLPAWTGLALAHFPRIRAGAASQPK